MSNRMKCPSCNSSTAYGEIHCFKCGYINPYKTTNGLFSEVSRAETKQVLQLRDDIVLAPRNFNPAALKWLYKAGIYDSVVICQRIAYCPGIDKVLIPAFKDSELMFYQLRSLDDNDSAKYITCGSTSTHTILYEDHPREILVICEDHLSAIRLRPFYNVMCLSGTSIKYNIINELLNNYTHFIFWLDADKPGREALYKNLARLKYNAVKHSIKAMFLGDTINNHTFSKVNYNKITKDPKFYLDSEIINILNEELITL